MPTTFVVSVPKGLHQKGPIPVSPARLVDRPFSRLSFPAFFGIDLRAKKCP
jgi:hypothetical protein